MGLAAEILASQLQHYRDGDALWDPAPPDGEELRIGDVGFIDTEGAFFRLFNTTTDDDTVNKDGVPAGFQPLKLNKKLFRTFERYRAPGPLTSSTVGHTSARLHAGANAANIAGGGLQYQFSCSSEAGAWVLLKDFSDKAYLLDSSAVKRYILQSHDSWVAFATGETFGLECRPDEVILVKGFVKTSAWSVAAYRSGVRSTQTMAVTGTVGGVGEAGFEFKIDSSEGYMFDTRYGPEGREAQTPLLRSHSPRPSIASEKGKGREILQGDSPAVNSSLEPSFPRDQNVFVSYYKIKHRMWWKKIVANAGPHQLPRGPDEDQGPIAILSGTDVSVEAVPSRHHFSLPIDDIIDYIFENSDAEVAIASHDDLAGLFPGDSWPGDIAAQLRLDGPKITVDENRLGYIDLRHIIVRQRTDALLQAVARQDQVEEEEQDRQTAIAQMLQLEEEERTGRAAEARAQEEGGRREQEGQSLAEDGPPEIMSGQSITETVQLDEPTQIDPPPSVDASFIPPSELSDRLSAHGPPSSSSELSQHERYPSIRNATQGRQYGSSVQLDGQIYLGENQLIPYPHLILADHAADGCAITSMAISYAKNRVATACEDHAVRVWDLITGALLMRLDGHREKTHTVAFSPDGSKLVSGGADHKGILWNLDSHSQITRLNGHTGDVWTCAYSPDGKYIATGSTDCMLKLWNGEDGKPLATIQDHTAVVMCVTFSPDSRRILSCADSETYVWNTDGSRVSKLAGHTGLIWSAKFSADGTRAVTAAEDQTTRIWDVQEGHELVTLAEHSGPVWSATFSPDDNYFVSGSYDGRVTLCDSYTGKEIHTLEDDHPSVVISVAYSKDGELVVAGCEDGAVKVWNAKSGEFVAELMGHEDKANALFTPDDCHVVSCSNDSTVRIWNIVDIIRL